MHIKLTSTMLRSNTVTDVSVIRPPYSTWLYSKDYLYGHADHWRQEIYSCLVKKKKISFLPGNLNGMSATSSVSFHHITVESIASLMPEDRGQTPSDAMTNDDCCEWSVLMQVDLGEAPASLFFKLLTLCNSWWRSFSCQIMSWISSHKFPWSNVYAFTRFKTKPLYHRVTQRWRFLNSTWKMFFLNFLCWKYQ